MNVLAPLFAIFNKLDQTSAQLMKSGDEINSELRVSIQQLIDHFNEKELFESKADMSRVKAQLTLTMNLEKGLIGQDMLQYGKNYEAVNQYAACIQIYSAIIRDFECVLDDVENADVFELTYLKEACEGLVRLTDDEEAKAKLKVIEKLDLTQYSL
jgi:hypothetical protein